ncbi:MAG: SCP2 sterol-binding domain-containing protein [Pseudomonadota bacterium]
MSLEAITEEIRGKMAMAAGFEHKVKFDFGDDGVIFVDGTQSPPSLSHEDEEAECTLKCSIETFQGFLDGTQDPTMAFMMGKLKVDGSMGLAMKLNSIIED